MPQPADDPTPETPPAARPPRRTRKFSLPDHHHEEHPAGAIEAFLEGPTARRRSHGRGQRADRQRPIHLQPAADWAEILRREAARQNATDLMPMLAGQGAALAGAPQPAEAIVAQLVAQTNAAAHA